MKGEDLQQRKVWGRGAVKEMSRLTFSNFIINLTRIKWVYYILWNA